MNVRRLHNDDGAILHHRDRRCHRRRPGRRRRADHGATAPCARPSALRQAAGTTYAADGAAQIAIDDLRTGHNTGNARACANWAFTRTALGTGCFGYNADGTTVGRRPAAGFYPAPKSSRTGGIRMARPPPTSSAPRRTPRVPRVGGVDHQREQAWQRDPHPRHQRRENGFTYKTNGSSGCVPRQGRVWSSSTIVRNSNGASSRQIVSGPAPDARLSAMQAPLVNCAAGTAPDPTTRASSTSQGPDPRSADAAGRGAGASPCSRATTTTSTSSSLTTQQWSNCLIHLDPGVLLRLPQRVTEPLPLVTSPAVRRRVERELGHDRGRQLDRRTQRCRALRQPDRERE